MKRTHSSFVISVSLATGCYRHIRIDASATLFALHKAILDAFGFNDDHAHVFFMNNRAWSDQDSYYIDSFVHDEDSDEDMRSSSEYTLTQAGLVQNKKFLYIFDFGDEWRFQCRVLKVLEEATAKPMVVRSVGEAPDQYEMYDEDDDEYDEDDDDEDDDDEDDDDEDDDLPFKADHAQAEKPEKTDPVIPDSLYDAALSFKKTKLWKKLYDTQLFAVRHSDGSIGYCSVMGMLGEHLALAVYPGDEGLASYQSMLESSQNQQASHALLAEHEQLLSQDCVMVSFQNASTLPPRERLDVNAYFSAHGITPRGRLAYPQFERFTPRCCPWYLNDATDQQHMLEALEAALDVSDHLILTPPEAIGFAPDESLTQPIPLLEKKDGKFVWSQIKLTPAKKADYPSPEIVDDIALAKLAKCKRSTGKWACAIFLHLEPISEEEVEDPVNAPYFPYILLIINPDTDLVRGVFFLTEPEDAQSCLQELINVVQQSGKPTQILVSDDRTQAFFAKLAPVFGAKLVRRKKIPSLEEAIAKFVERFDPTKKHSKDDIGEDDLEAMKAALANPAMYTDMPDEMLMLLTQLMNSNELPNNVSQLIKSECKKRGIKL